LRAKITPSSEQSVGGGPPAEPAEVKAPAAVAALVPAVAAAKAPVAASATAGRTARR